jgi:hypothetical protein
LAVLSPGGFYDDMQYSKNFDCKMSLVRERENREDQVKVAVREIGHKRSGTYTAQNGTQ